MPDYHVLRGAPPVFTAAGPKQAIQQALALDPEFKDATGNFSVNLYVIGANGTSVRVDVASARTMTVDVTP